jgi:single-strand DNA-binding protein
MSTNLVILNGNLGQDPEIKRLTDGTVLANLSIATSEFWTDKNTGEKKERVQWHRIVVWPEGLVKLIEKWLAKGDKVQVMGQLEHRKWQDKDGNDRYSTEVVLRPFKGQLDINRCKKMDKSGNRGSSSEEYGSDGGGSSAGRSSGGNSGAKRVPKDMDDEIPF